MYRKYSMTRPVTSLRASMRPSPRGAGSDAHSPGFNPSSFAVVNSPCFIPLFIAVVIRLPFLGSMVRDDTRHSKTLQPRCSKGYVPVPQIDATPWDVMKHRKIGLLIHWSMVRSHHGHHPFNYKVDT